MSDDQQSQQVGKAGSTVLLATSARVISQLTSLTILIVAGRFLSPELFGVFVLATILMNISAAVQYSGIYNYILREGGLRDHIRTAFTLHALVGASFILGIVILSALVYLSGGSTLLALLMLSTAPISFGFIFTSWFEALLLRNGEVKFYYWLLLGTDLLGFLTTISLLFLGFQIWALIIARYAAVSMIVLVLLLKVRRIPLPGFHKKQARKISAYSIPLYGEKLLSIITGYGAEIAMGAVLNSRAVGLFRMGMRTSTAAFDVFSQTARVLIWQIVGQLARQDRIHEPVWIKIFALLFAVVGTALGLLIVVAQPFVLIVLGEDWIQITPIIQIVCCVKIFTVFSLVANAQLAAAGATKLVLKVRFFEALTLAASLSFLVFYGPLGAAISLFPPVLVGSAMLYQRLSKITETHIGKLFAEILPSVTISALSVLSGAVAYRLCLGQPLLLQVLLPSLRGGLTFLGVSFVIFRAWFNDTIRTLSEALHVTDSDPSDMSMTK